jgi:hypothetical protein
VKGTLTTVSLTALCVFLSTGITPALDIHVAPGGDDAASGTKESPFATLTRARDAVRGLKSTAKSPIDVVLRGGVYRFEQPLLFTPEDSGTSECPITYRAMPGEKPVISGGKKITGWKHAAGALWTADIPEVKQGTWYFRQLFVNGQRRARARLPKEGDYGVAAAADPPKRAFKFNPGEIDPKWRNLDDVELVVLQFWSEARLRIESIDQTANIVRLTGDTFRPIVWSKCWYVENVFEGLSKPGQWYLDRKAGALYYWPLPGEKLNEAEFVAPVTQQWLRLEGDYKTRKFVQHIAFQGLAFEHSAWDLDKKLGYSYPQASIELTPGKPLWVGWGVDEGLSTPQSQVVVPAGIYAKGARHIRFENNTIAHTGAWGIHFAQGGCKDNHIVGNSMTDIGAGAVRIGGPDATDNDAEESGRTAITDNRIHDCAQVYFGAPAVYVGQSSGNRIAHNEITGGCEWAISVGWTWGYMPPNNARDNIVEYNHCHHIGTSLLGTHGAIYLIGVQPGTVVRHNWVHDVGGEGSGIVLDNSAAGIVVENNIVHNIACDALLFNFNDLGNIVQNNIVAVAGRSLMNRSGDTGKLDQTGVFYRNIFYAKGEHTSFFRPEKWANYDIVMDYNLYYDASAKPLKLPAGDFEQWKKKGLDANSIVADPRFVDVDKGDFRLKPDSPAFKLGFRPIDLSHVGIRNQSSRKDEVRP